MKKWVYFIIFLLIVFATGVIYFYFNGGKKLYKIGVITNLTSPNSYVGLFGIRSLSDAVELYAEEEFQIIAENDSWDSSEIRKAFLKIRRVPLDFLVMITTSTSVLEIKNELNWEKFPVFSLSATSLKISGTIDNIYSLIPNVRDEQRRIAEYLNKNSINKIFIIKENKNISYTDPALIEFRRVYKGKILSVYSYETSLLDIDSISTFLKNIRNFNVDGIYLLIGFSYEVGVIVQLIRKYFPEKIPIILTPWGGETGIETMGEKVNNVIIPYFFDLKNKNSRSRKWYIEFFKKYDKRPTLSSFLAYETGCLIGKAIREKISPVIFLDQDNFYQFLIVNEDCFFEKVYIKKCGDIDRKMIFHSARDIFYLTRE